MINEPDGLDNKADRVIRDDDAETWRIGEQVEATLVTERGPGTLIKVSHADGNVFLRASAFAEVHPVGEDPERLTTLKALRTQLVEERLAAAEARTKTTLANGVVGRLNTEVGRLRRDGEQIMRSYRLAVAALERIRTLDSAGPLAPLPFLDVLLPTTDRQGSLAQPCDADLSINQRYPGCGCDEPCLIEVATLPCMLPRGHAFVSGDESHRTLDGREFDTGEIVLADEDD